MQRDQWRFVFDGQEYAYLGYIGAADALLIKQHAGLSVLGFLGGIVTADPGALVAMVFLAKRQAGEDVVWDELVEQMTGENDLMALVNSVVPLAPADAKPARKTRSKTADVEAAVEEPAPAA